MSVYTHYIHTLCITNKKVHKCMILMPVWAYTIYLHIHSSENMYKYTNMPLAKIRTYLCVKEFLIHTNMYVLSDSTSVTTHWYDYMISVNSCVQVSSGPSLSHISSSLNNLPGHYFQFRFRSAFLRPQQRSRNKIRVMRPSKHQRICWAHPAQKCRASKPYEWTTTLNAIVLAGRQIFPHFKDATD